MPFADLVGNDRIKKLIMRGVAENRIRQGLILAGPEGIGKHRFALALAQAVNCRQTIEGDACGVCVSCKKINDAEHPDVLTIERDGQFIKIDQMRSMSQAAQYRPYEGRRRVYIIEDAERLNERASNSILKTLEEPPDTTLLLLVTSKPYSLLETIRSRCQILTFAPLTFDELVAHLSKQGNRPREEVELLARLARGSIGRALEIDPNEYRQKRNTMLQLVETMLVGRDTVRLMRAAEYLGRKLERDEFDDHIDVLMVILSDIFHLKLGASPDSIINADIVERMISLSEPTSLEAITSWVDSLEVLMQALPRNVNRQLGLESQFLGAARAL
jgi:DNA polymerase-3 subunit delta'